MTEAIIVALVSLCGTIVTAFFAFKGMKKANLADKEVKGVEITIVAQEKMIEMQRLKIEDQERRIKGLENKVAHCEEEHREWIAERVVYLERIAQLSTKK